MKTSATFRIDAELLERARNTVWHVGQGLTITDLLEQGLETVLKQLEKKHNNGKPFPPREGEIARSRKK